MPRSRQSIWRSRRLGAAAFGRCAQLFERSKPTLEQQRLIGILVVLRLLVALGFLRLLVAFVSRPGEVSEAVGAIDQVGGVPGVELDLEPLAVTLDRPTPRIEAELLGDLPAGPAA